MYCDGLRIDDIRAAADSSPFYLYSKERIRCVSLLFFYPCSIFCSPVAGCCAWLLPQLIPCRQRLPFLPLLQGAHSVRARVQALLVQPLAAPVACCSLFKKQAAAGPSRWLLIPLPLAESCFNARLPMLQAELQGVPGGAAGPLP